MKQGQIISKGKVIAETNQGFHDAYGVARWAHLMGWNVMHFDDSKGYLENDSGTKVATLRIFESE